MIAVAEEAGFDVIVTCDQHWRHQLNLSGRRIAIIVLETNQWRVIRRTVETVINAVNAATPGSYASLPFALPPKPAWQNLDC